jgi:hypothetical protein
MSEKLKVEKGKKSTATTTDTTDATYTTLSGNWPYPM